MRAPIPALPPAGSTASIRWLRSIPRVFSASNSYPAITHFVHTHFLGAEASGSAARGTGWGPRTCGPARRHHRRDRAVLSEMHSQGEYVFDRGWADAYERAGGRLLSEVAGVGSPLRRQPAPVC